MKGSQNLEPYESEPGAVVLRAIFGAIIGAGLGGLFGGIWFRLLGAIAVGWASVAYGEKFWRPVMKYWGRWRM